MHNDSVSRFEPGLGGFASAASEMDIDQAWLSGSSLGRVIAALAPI